MLLRMIKKGKLENSLSQKPFSTMPKSEYVQTVEVTQLPDGSIREPDEAIAALKQGKIAALRDRYGAVDESQIVWVMVRRRASAG